MESLSARRQRAALALAALPVIFTGCAAGASASSDEDPLPAADLPALAGFAQELPELDTGELEGPAVLNFWATWCDPCRVELPELQRASEQRPDVRFLGIDEGFDADESVEFLDEVGVTYEQFVDVDGTLAFEMDIAQLPATVVIDADGEFIYRHLGDLSYDDIVAVLADIPLSESANTTDTVTHADTDS